jgi:acyl-CoA thioesterase-1
MSYRYPLFTRLLLLLYLLSGPALSNAAPGQTVLVLGDSISAAYGMSLEEGWVALLARQLQGSHPDYQVVNASISGETSAGAASRLAELLSLHQPAVVVVELGGNDGLRGYPIKRLRANLLDIATRAETSGARVLLLGMEIPPNYGSRYTLQFRDSFAQVADETGSALVPFLLEGIATVSALMQADGIHPRPEAQSLLLENVWPSLEPLLR